MFLDKDVGGIASIGKNRASSTSDAEYTEHLPAEE